eukprot:SAG31_NODE_920_length_10987_cov_4.682757_5_plen_108_part_00
MYPNRYETQNKMIVDSESQINTNALLCGSDRTFKRLRAWIRHGMENFRGHFTRTTKNAQQKAQSMQRQKCFASSHSERLQRCQRVRVHDANEYVPKVVSAKSVRITK